MRDFVFLAEAEDELIQSIRYYEQERPGLGDDFLAEVQDLTLRLLDFPDSGSTIFRDVRRARVSRFPYDLVYQIRQDLLMIIAVMHQRREPGYWKNRL